MDHSSCYVERKNAAKDTISKQTTEPFFNDPIANGCMLLSQASDEISKSDA